MIGYNASLESELAKLLSDIRLYKQLEKYEEAIEAIKRSLDICKQIATTTTEQRKKELMAKNAMSLQVALKQCQDALGIKPTKKTASRTTTSTTYRPTQHTQTAGTKKVTYDPKTGKKVETKEENDKPELLNKDGEPVVYEFGEVDLRGFLHDESNDEVTFDMVVGMEEEKKLIEREFFVDDVVKAFRRSMKTKAKNFILLYGVPGTGKTFFAKAISTELKKRQSGDTVIPFFSVVSGQLKDSKVGGVEHNITALFEFCKQFDNCVLFLDEFDSLVPDRQKETGDPTAVGTVTTFLQMLDGFSSAKGTLLIAATNCPYNIDGAVLSRAAAQIEIPLPTHDVITGVLKKQLGSQLNYDVSLDDFANKLEGYSNRDITMLVTYIKDQLTDQFVDDWPRIKASDPERYSNLTPEEIKEVADEFATQYKVTNEIIDKAIYNNPPKTKQSDKVAIERYKKGLSK